MKAGDTKAERFALEESLLIKLACGGRLNGKRGTEGNGARTILFQEATPELTQPFHHSSISSFIRI